MPTFPAPTDTSINMMPFVMGDPSTIPPHLLSYQRLINNCDLTSGEVVYLTVHESLVKEGQTQRRPGIHTDGTSVGPWGGGSWGGKGIWLASTDGNCLMWDEETQNVDRHGALLCAPKTTPFRATPNTLYHISDRTPHCSVPASETHYRQFFRLVGPDIHAWYAQHSTPSQFGVSPRCPIVTTSKF